MKAERLQPFARVGDSNCMLRDVAWIALAVLTITGCATQAHAVTAASSAHAIADKFSRATSDTQARTGAEVEANAAKKARDSVIVTAGGDARSDAEDLKAYEEDLLKRAQAEADARSKADLAREQAAAQQKAKAQKEKIARQISADLAAAEEAHRKAKAAAKRAEEMRKKKKKAREMQMAAEREKAAARESEARELADRLRAARRLREETRALAAAEAKARSTQQTRTNDDAHAGSDSASGSETDTQPQGTDVRRDLVQRPAPHALGGPTMTKPIPTLPNTAQRPEPASRPAPVNWRQRPSADAPAIIMNGLASDDVKANSHRATVLLIMQPGNRGIRRWNKSADPMLCVESSCYISKGAAMPARQLSKGKAFGPSVALGMRAGACRHSTTCVFRDVDLTADRVWLRPIDLRIIRHDRREARIISADPTCAVKHGRISCRRTVISKDYRAWIIPEDVAQRAGADALLAALGSGLSDHRLASSPKQ